MQEEIENRTVTLIISAVKLTARELKAGMDKYLSEKKSKAMEKARAAPEKPSGKQTVKQLIGQNQGVSNIEITNSNIKGFERIARKYGVDFAVKKDRSVSPPKYFVFFKARDADALTAAFKEYTAYELKRAAKAQNRPSVLAHLQALKAKVQAITPSKSRNQNRGITIRLHRFQYAAADKGACAGAHGTGCKRVYASHGQHRGHGVRCGGSPQL
mgnify:FL=1